MVLIADDDEDICDSLADVLRSRGYAVAIVRGGRQALEFLEANRPCLLLLDLNMPIVTGWDVAARVSTKPELAGLPICVITAGRYVQAPEGSVALLRKPFEMRQLMDTVRKYCVHELD